MAEARRDDDPGDNQPDEETIARRAYELSESEDAGTPEENWAKAERELRGESRPSEPAA